MNCRSNPGTPTQPRRPDFIGVVNNQPQQQQNQVGLTYYDFPMHQQPTSQAQQYYQQQQNQYISGGAGPGIVRQSSQQAITPFHPNGSPQRRFLSEGELLGRNNGGSGNELSYVGRTTNTSENIRELAQSPQRGIYNWKMEDNSPEFNQMGGMMYTANQGAVGQNNVSVNNSSNNSNLMNRPTVQQQLASQQYHPEYNSIYHRSNPTSPTQLQQQQQATQMTQVSTQPQQFNQNGAIVTMAMSGIPQQAQQPPATRQQSNVSNIINNIVAKSANTSAYHPALRGGIQVFPPQLTVSPQIKRKQTPTRPMSFVRALEMADSIEMTATNTASGPQGGEGLGIQDVNNKNSNSEMGSGNQTPSQAQQNQQNPADRGSVYDMNYEISV